MPQNNFVEQSVKIYGRPLDYEIRKAKKEARNKNLNAKLSRKLIGMKAKLHHKKMAAEKVQLKKNIKATENVKQKNEVIIDASALPGYLLDRNVQEEGRSLNSKIKQRRKDKAAKFTVPIAKVEGVSEAEVFGIVTSGKRKNKHWKRMVNKPCFVGNDFVRKGPKFERFIRPMSLRYNKAHVTHPELKTTFTLPIIAVKKNPHSNLFTSLGILSKGTIIEVNVSELGLVNGSGQIVWSKYAQITNKPENDACVNAILLV